jgi:hypothetical protein
LVLNGSPSATSLPVTTTLTTNANIGRVIKMTSGARNGQYCVVKSNTTTGITVYASGDSSMTGIAVPALSGAPAAGDTFDVYDSASPDGTHPGLAQQAHVF